MPFTVSKTNNHQLTLKSELQGLKFAGKDSVLGKIQDHQTCICESSANISVCEGYFLKLGINLKPLE